MGEIASGLGPSANTRIAGQFKNSLETNANKEANLIDVQMSTAMVYVLLYCLCMQLFRIQELTHLHAVRRLYTA